MIPSKRGHPLDGVDNSSFRTTISPQLSRPTQQRKIVQQNTNNQLCGSKREQQKQQDQHNVTNEVPPVSRSEYAIAKSKTACASNPSQNLWKETSQTKLGTSFSNNNENKPIIKMEERKMWRTIWNAEGGKEPFDQFVVRKRNEAMNTLTRLGADAKVEASASVGNKRVETCENFHLLLPHSLLLNGFEEICKRPILISL